MKQEDIYRRKVVQTLELLFGGITLRTVNNIKSNLWLCFYYGTVYFWKARKWFLIISRKNLLNWTQIAWDHLSSVMTRMIKTMSFIHPLCLGQVADMIQKLYESPTHRAVSAPSWFVPNLTHDQLRNLPRKFNASVRKSVREGSEELSLQKMGLSRPVESWPHWMASKFFRVQYGGAISIFTM